MTEVKHVLKTELIGTEQNCIRKLEMFLVALQNCNQMQLLVGFGILNPIFAGLDSTSVFPWATHLCFHVLHAFSLWPRSVRRSFTHTGLPLLFYTFLELGEGHL